MKRVLTIIVTYNFEPWLDKCIQSLLSSTYPNDVLILDNNSQDTTVQSIKQRYPSIRMIANSSNLGFGRANNVGLNIALEEGYDFAFLVNQDAWIASDCLEKLIAGCQDEFGIISPMHLDGTERKLDTGFADYIKNATEKDNYGVVPFINAAFWLLPTHVLKTIGGFSPIFFHYGEDKDYANRIRYHQLKTAFIKDAFAYHDRQNRPFKREAYYKGEFVYHLTEYCNINYSCMTAFGNSFGASLKKAITAVLKRNFNDGGDYFKIAWRIFCLTPNVIKTRSFNKRAEQAIL